MQKVTGYVPKEKGDVSQGKLAFKDADIIVIPAGIPRKSSYYIFCFWFVRSLYIEAQVVDDEIQASLV